MLEYAMVPTQTYLFQDTWLAPLRARVNITFQCARTDIPCYLYRYSISSSSVPPSQSTEIYALSLTRQNTHLIG